MASAAQIAANRANAARSTGPRTAKGKARVALNGLKHGMLSVSLLPGASNAKFLALSERLLRPMPEPPRGASKLSPKIGFGPQNDFCFRCFSQANAEQNKREARVSPLPQLALPVGLRP